MNEFSQLSGALKHWAREVAPDLVIMITVHHSYQKHQKSLSDPRILSTPLSMQILQQQVRLLPMFNLLLVTEYIYMNSCAEVHSLVLSFITISNNLHGHCPWLCSMRLQFHLISLRLLFSYSLFFTLLLFPLSFQSSYIMISSPRHAQSSQYNRWSTWRAEEGRTSEKEVKTVIK